MTATRDDEFRSFVIERRHTLLRTATLLTAGDAHRAEDLVQTTLTRLYVTWPKFRQTSHPAAYARRALFNALLDEERRPWRRREQASAELPERPLPCSEDNRTREDVDQALRELPPRMRAAVIFRYIYDLSVDETADLLSCTRGTVKSQTARGLKKLRQHLGVDLTAPRDQPPPPATAPHHAVTTSRSI